MIIGRIVNFHTKEDEGYVEIISANNFLEIYYFKPSLIKFKIEPEQIICISENKNGVDYFEFDLESHKQFINIEDIKNRTRGISILENMNIMDFIIDNDIHNKQNKKLNELSYLKKLIGFRNGYTSSKLNYDKNNSVIKIIEEYKIYYSEGGYNKPGDWSRGWIKIQTSLSHQNLDIYLQKLLPNFNFNLGNSDDCEEYRFKNDIIKKLRLEIGEKNIEEINQLCSDLTRQIQNFAKLVYREEEHVSSILEYCYKLKKEIKNEYILKSLKL